MELFTSLITVVGPLIGVWVGAALSRRSSDRDWMREKRSEAYLELLDLLLVINQTFAVGLKVSRLRTESAHGHGHDFEGVENAWHGQIDQLSHAELRIEMLGGQLSRVYSARAHHLMLDMMDALEREDLTEDEWGVITDRGRDLVDELVAIARRDIGVSDQKFFSKLSQKRRN